MNTTRLSDHSELALAGYGEYVAAGLIPVDRLKVLNGDPAGFSD